MALECQHELSPLGAINPLSLEITAQGRTEVRDLNPTCADQLKVSYQKLKMKDNSLPETQK